MLESSVSVLKRLADRKDIIVHRHAKCSRDGGIEAECLPDDGVEVRKGGELFRRGVLAAYPQELAAKLRLHLRRPGESEQAPRQRRACGFVSCGEQAAQISA